MILDILPWAGLGPLRFGMNPRQVCSVFDEDQVHEEWMGGNLNDSLLFRGLILEFDRYNSKGPLKRSRFCGVTATVREDIWLFGKKLADWTRAEVATYVEARAWTSKNLPNGHLDIVDLDIALGFDAGNHVNFFVLDEPGIRIIEVDRTRWPVRGYRVSFQGWPQRDEYRCVRTGCRWKYVGVVGPLPGSGPYEGILTPLGGRKRLRPGDTLVPVGDEPRVPTSASTPSE